MNSVLATKPYWELACRITTRSYESSFGSRESTLGSMQMLRWNKELSAFQIGSKDDILWGSWVWETHVCSRSLAEDILVVCGSDLVWQHFSGLATDVKPEVYATGDTIFGLELERQPSRLYKHYYHLGALKISYYTDENKVSCLEVPANLTQDFLNKIKSMKRPDVASALV